ncbi:MAG: hypothetical protein K8S25_04550 [Alphaproteobacteria bacterium]|nr:hypothetical protein [Alphaproteobacteria bacterium]
MINARTPMLATLALLLVSAPASADDWPGPQTKEVFSTSRDYFVRIVPGNSIGDTVGFKGAHKGNYATAEFYRRDQDRSYKLIAETVLLNPIAPVEFNVANDGHLVTIDNWHNRGYGQVLVVVAPDGKLVKSYRLADLFQETEIEQFSHSVSSINWHEGPVFFQQDQRTLLITTKTGASLELNAHTGAFQYCETVASTFRCRDTNENRHWHPYKPPA